MNNLASKMCTSERSFCMKYMLCHAFLTIDASQYIWCPAHMSPIVQIGM